MIKYLNNVIARFQMKIDIRYLRWIFLGLYVVIVLGLFASAYADFLPIWLFPMHMLTGNLPATLLVLLVTFGSQALFVFSAGTLDLCRPIRRQVTCSGNYCILDDDDSCGRGVYVIARTIHNR